MAGYNVYHDLFCRVNFRIGFVIQFGEETSIYAELFFSLNILSNLNLFHLF